MGSVVEEPGSIGTRKRASALEDDLDLGQSFPRRPLRTSPACGVPGRRSDTQKKPKTKGAKMSNPKTISIDNEVYVRQSDLPPSLPSSNVKIVVLQRGWVVVGSWQQEGPHVTLSHAAVVRWGTSRGLGQLALEGPQTSTVLDPSGTIEFHELTVVMAINVDESKWASLS